VHSQKKNKIPCSKKKPTCLKKPSDNYVSQDSYLQYSPVWRFDFIDLQGPWGWLNVESKDKIQDILEKLQNFEKLTWEEIKKNKKCNHEISIEQISKKARDRLIEIKKDDLEEIFSLRLSGKNRVFGVLEDGIFYIIWWDPNHKVCDSELKHT